MEEISKDELVMVVDDDPVSLELTCRFLEILGHQIISFNDSEKALKRFKEGGVSAIVTDLVMPNINGVELAEQARKITPEVAIVVVSAQHNRDALLQLQKQGIFFLLTKPFSKDQINFSLLGALELRRSRLAADTIKEETVANAFGIVGNSPKIKELRRQISRAAATEVPVLIFGESGTGKEIVSRAIHSMSSRSKNNLISVNCAAVTPSLAESEFFGHVEGAFTGATRKHKGLIEHANDSTLFLDEIGDMPLELQAKLLRVLDSGELRKVGEPKPIIVYIRLLSATNRDLKQMVKEGKFRQDLYYRISGFTVNTIPLRDRKEDIPILTNYFLNEISNDLGTQINIDQEAISLLTNHDWPGNVRELKHCLTMISPLIEHNYIVGDDIRELLDKVDVSTSTIYKTYSASKKKVIENFEREYFTSLLASTKGNVSQAANLAKMHRKNLTEKIQNLNISPDNFRV